MRITNYELRITRRRGRIIVRNLLLIFYTLHSTFYIISCTAPAKIGNLDLVQWRADRGGCKGQRQSQIADFKSIEKEILAKHIDEVTALLGRPDIHQLGSRDQKFYIYFFKKGIHCQEITKKSDAASVVLRFNAIGLLSEITYPVAFTSNDE